MAKNKKSFILYCDQQALFNQLPDDKAGQLIKLIFAYVNDENPVIDDLLLKVAFAPIQQTFKRDLKKYVALCEKNSENARKRWHKNNATAYDRMPNDAKHADGDSDSDSGRVNDSDIIIKEKSKKENLVYPFNTSTFKEAYKIWKDYKKEQHNFKYKSAKTEQAFLKQLSKEFTTEHQAIEAIHYSMANGYKGVFKPSNPQNNGNKNNQVQYNEELKRQLINNIKQ